MIKEDYPERLYSSKIRSTSQETKDYFEAFSFDKPVRNGDNIEYTRSDIVEHLFDIEYKVGFEEGSVFGANDDWHKYPDEKPFKYNVEDVIVTLKDNTVIFAWYSQQDGQFYQTDGDDCITQYVIAWREKPEPYKAEL